MCIQPQFVLRFLISFSFVCFYCLLSPGNLFILLICMYIIHCFNFTIHLIMTEVRSKRLLPLIFIVKKKKTLMIQNIRQGWHSVESTRLSPMWPRFDAWTWCHNYVG